MTDSRQLVTKNTGTMHDQANFCIILSSGETLLDLSLARCETAISASDCKALVDESSDAVWLIPAGWTPQQAWIRVTLSSGPVWMSRVMITKQFQGE